MKKTIHDLVNSIDIARDTAFLDFVLKVAARAAKSLADEKCPADIRVFVARRILGSITAYACGAPARMRAVAAHQKRSLKALDRWLLSRKRGQVHLIKKQ